METKNLKSNLLDKYADIANKSLIRVQYSCSGNSTSFEESDHVSYRTATANDFPEIVILLSLCELPIKDIFANQQYFEVAEIDQKIIACAGFEVHDQNALFRSLAVKPLYRGLKIGHEITSRVVSAAKEKNVDKLFLLTTTAERFFERIGWQLINRNEVPEIIAATSLFASICPSTASCMRLQQ